MDISYLENPQILKCLTDVFFGFDMHSRVDDIKFLLHALQHGAVPFKQADPSDPVEVFANVTRYKKATKKRFRHETNNGTLRYISPFNDFMKNVQNAHIDPSGRSITFSETDKHAEITVNLDEIGEGSYGKVYMLELGGKKYIIKQDLWYSKHSASDKDPESIEQHCREAFKEAFINIILQHDPKYGGHVGKLIKVLWDSTNNNILFMIEHIEHTIQGYIKKNNDLSLESIKLTTVDTNPKLIDCLRGIVERSESYYTDIPKYTITHNKKETGYPYTFKIFYNTKMLARLRLVKGMDDIERVEFRHAKGDPQVNIPLDHDKRKILQKLIYTIMNNEDKQEYMNPIFNNLGAVLEHFRHTYGFYHRDLHTGNIMITDDGKVKLIDFGMSSMRGLMMQEEPLRYDLLILLCCLIEHNPGLSDYILDRIKSFFHYGGDYTYSTVFSKLGKAGDAVFHQVYYYKMDDPRNKWNTKVVYGKPTLEWFKESMAHRFLPEVFKTMWDIPADPPAFPYAKPCDMQVLLLGNSPSSKLVKKLKGRNGSNGGKRKIRKTRKLKGSRR